MFEYLGNFISKFKIIYILSSIVVLHNVNSASVSNLQDSKKTKLNEASLDNIKPKNSIVSYADANKTPFGLELNSKQSNSTINFQDKKPLEKNTTSKPKVAEVKKAEVKNVKPLEEVKEEIKINELESNINPKTSLVNYTDVKPVELKPKTEEIKEVKKAEVKNVKPLEEVKEEIKEEPLNQSIPLSVNLKSTNKSNFYLGAGVSYNNNAYKFSKTELFDNTVIIPQEEKNNQKESFINIANTLINVTTQNINNDLGFFGNTSNLRQCEENNVDYNNPVSVCKKSKNNLDSIILVPGTTDKYATAKPNTLKFDNTDHFVSTMQNLHDRVANFSDQLSIYDNDFAINTDNGTYSGGGILFGSWNPSILSGNYQDTFIGASNLKHLMPIMIYRYNQLNPNNKITVGEKNSITQTELQKIFKYEDGQYVGYTKEGFEMLVSIVLQVVNPQNYDGTRLDGTISVDEDTGAITFKPSDSLAFFQSITNNKTEASTLNSDIKNLKGENSKNTFGVHLKAGYEHFFDNNFFVSPELELEINFGKLVDGKNSLILSSPIHTNLLLRAGYEFKNNKSIYLLGGLQHRKLNISYSNMLDQSINQFNFVIGTGAEIKITEKLGLYLEYAYSISGKTNLDLIYNNNLKPTKTIIGEIKDFKTTTSSVKIGARYHFGRSVSNHMYNSHTPQTVELLTEKDGENNDIVTKNTNLKTSLVNYADVKPAEEVKELKPQIEEIKEVKKAEVKNVKPLEEAKKEIKEEPKIEKPKQKEVKSKINFRDTKPLEEAKEDIKINEFTKNTKSKISIVNYSGVKK